MRGNTLIYILVMFITTYIIRMIPITFINKKIKSTFVRSFLYYVPYVTLSAMIVPSIFFSTSSVISAACGFAAALLLAFKDKSLLLVAAGACLVVFLVELIPGSFDRAVYFFYNKIADEYTDRAYGRPLRALN